MCSEEGGVREEKQQGCGLGVLHGLHSFSNEVWPRYPWLHVGKVQPDPCWRNPRRWRLAAAGARGSNHQPCWRVCPPMRVAPTSSFLWALIADCAWRWEPEVEAAWRELGGPEQRCKPVNCTTPTRDLWGGARGTRTDGFLEPSQARRGEEGPVYLEEAALALNRTLARFLPCGLGQRT